MVDACSGTLAVGSSESWDGRGVMWLLLALLPLPLPHSVNPVNPLRAKPSHPYVMVFPCAVGFLYELHSVNLIFCILLGRGSRF